MSIEKARLLIRVANQLPDGSDRRRLLEWVDELLSHTHDEPISVVTNALSFPIAVFRRYKGRLYRGQLLKGWKIQMDGKEYPSPSAAAVEISGHPENGWRMWRYMDEVTNKEQPIDRLRNKEQ